MYKANLTICQFAVLFYWGMYIFIGPPTISNFTTAKQIDKGGSLELRCEALIPNLQNVNQTVDFQWAKYGQDDKETIIPIPDNDERVVTASHRDPNRLHFFYGTLRINPLSQLDSGSYTCRINSSIGTSSYTTDTVSVNVKCNVIAHCHTLVLTIHHVHFHFSCA